MDFTALQTAFFRRGFDDYNDAGAGLTEAKRWLNQAYLDICEQANWPFLLAEVTAQSGASTITITDLRQVEQVVDTAQSAGRTLDWKDRRTLEDIYDLTQTGDPRFFYFSSQTALKTYPLGGTITVRYWKVPAELSAGGDTPILPARFHELIVDGAIVKALLAKDNYEQAGVVRQSYFAGLDTMRRALLQQQFSTNEFILDMSDSADWGGWPG